MTHQLMTPDEVAHKLRIAKRTLRRWVMSGLVPAPIRLGKRVVRWRVEDIEEVVASASQAAAVRAAP